jgi:aspartyl-tRNA(Asn)/glutamyl-tRNA(Gln) amidotransferase subunit A
VAPIDAADLTLLDAAAALREGSLGVLELTEACLARAEAVQARLAPFVLLDPEGARAQAAALAAGAPRGPLHGIPVAVKDIIDVAGFPTRAASRVLEDAPPAARDAPVVTRLRDAGAVIVGKTTTHELAMGTTTPGTGNPHDSSRSPGGSSGGSAVAVATGAALAALGTDTAGSIRIPAAMCGVCGLKPRRGALPADGIVPLAPSMDVPGPLARDVPGLAAAWSALSGSAVPAVERPLRLGVPDPPAPCEPGVAAAVARAVDRAGAEPVPVAVPPWEAWPPVRGLVLAAEALAAHRAAGWYPARADRYGHRAIVRLSKAERLSPERVAAARAALDALSRDLRAALAAVDVLVLPTSPITATPRDDDPAAIERDTDRMIPLCGPVNAAGLAAVSVPCGTDERGLPVGLQLVAADEATALAAAATFAPEAAPVLAGSAA